MGVYGFEMESVHIVWRVADSRVVYFMVINSVMKIWEASIDSNECKFLKLPNIGLEIAFS